MRIVVRKIDENRGRWDDDQSAPQRSGQKALDAPDVEPEAEDVF